MRLLSVVVVGLAAVAMTACDDDEFTAPDMPPTAAVRFVNGLSNGTTVDIRAVDQIEWSPTANALGYRHATVYYPTETTQARHIRVFGACVTSTPSTCTPENVSTVYVDTTITFTAGTRVTLLLRGSTASGAGRGFVVITDDVTAPPTGSIGIRLVNASTGAIDGYVTAATTDPLPATPTMTAAAGPGTTSAYVNRTAGNAAIRVTASASTTVLASTPGASAPSNPSGTGFQPAAGVNTSGTKFSVYYFPAVTGVVTTATALWLVDRNPAD